MAQTNSQALKEALERAAALVEVNAEVFTGLKTLVETGTDAELLHINPVDFARRNGFDQHQTVTAFVGGSKTGAFEFTWSLTCPLCGYYTHHTDGLSHLSTTFYCSRCDQVSPSTMDSLVEVAFTVPASIRSPAGLDRPAVAGEDWLAPFQNRSVRLDPAVVEVAAHHLLWSGPVRASSEQRVAVALSARATRVAAISHNVRATLRCPPDHAGAVVELHDQGVQIVEYTRAPGVLIRNRTTRDAICDVAIDINASDFQSRPSAAVFDGFLSGRDLLCNQAFRDLYASETLSAGIALSVEAQSVLFTDLKGSTQLYDSIGDLQAFALVSEHFKILLTAVQECGGAVVKTIGDAVMATFPQTSDGVRAALQMATTLTRFNLSSGLPPLSLKIGLHVGPCIVVSSNGRPDYFGQTVNIAARVQALAEGDELVLTEAAWGAPGVGHELAQHKLTEQVSDAALKGVAERVKVHTVRITPDAS